MLNSKDLIRKLKLSNLGPKQCLDEALLEAPGSAGKGSDKISMLL